MQFRELLEPRIEKAIMVNSVPLSRPYLEELRCSRHQSQHDEHPRPEMDSTENLVRRPRKHIEDFAKEEGKAGPDDARQCRTYHAHHNDPPLSGVELQDPPQAHLR